MDKNIIKVKIKDMRHQLPNFNSDAIDIHTNPRYKDITKSIEEEGFNPKKYGYPTVVYHESQNIFEITDGNHRIKILRELYGDNYEVEVENGHKILTITLGDIFSVFDEEHNYTTPQKAWIDIRSKIYRWSSLQNNLKENDYNPQKFSYIEVISSKDDDADNIGNVLELPYICEDGNHRLRILKDMYPPTHKIDVQVQLTEIESCIKKTIPTKEDVKEPRKILEYIKGVMICLYFIVFHLKYTALMLLIIGLSFVFLPAFKKEGENHIPHKKLRWLYNDYSVVYGVLMTIYHNLRLLICGATLLTFSGYLVIYDTINFLILAALVLIIQTIQQKLYPENENND